jgi:hypothetical protein
MLRIPAIHCLAGLLTSEPRVTDNHSSCLLERHAIPQSGQTEKFVYNIPSTPPLTGLITDARIAYNIRYTVFAGVVSHLASTLRS